MAGASWGVSGCVTAYSQCVVGVDVSLPMVGASWGVFGCVAAYGGGVHGCVAAYGGRVMESYGGSIVRGPV